MQKLFPTQWLITDSKTIDPIKAAQKLPPNSGIILRDYELSAVKRFELGKVLKEICIKKRAPLLIAKDTNLALKLKADGVHFPEFAIKEIHQWKHKKPFWIITASTHSRLSVNRAKIAGADAVFLSPIFKTPSHPYKKPISIMGANMLLLGIKRHIYVYALGGVKPFHLKALKLADFKGFGGISWIKN